MAQIPTNTLIGTAAAGAVSIIEAIGTMTLSATSSCGSEFMQSIPQVFHVPSFSHRMFSPHGFATLGYEAIHNVGRSLQLVHSESGMCYEFPVETMHSNTDFVAF